ncbi:MAG: hypothetical protein KAG61_12020 [Bacteriovoracaceae bacterium]|nr:hypothetical protein [Bacteriovoracaceae bacterium]
MKDKKVLIKEYQALEFNVHKFEKQQKTSKLAEDKRFWEIEIECTKKEMKTISLRFCNFQSKVA